MYKIKISRDTGGYDITVYDQDNKPLKSNWKHDYNSAMFAAGVFADFYRDDTGELAEVITEY